MVKIDVFIKIIIKLKIIWSLSIIEGRRSWGEGFFFKREFLIKEEDNQSVFSDISKMSFELVRVSIDGISVDGRRFVVYKTRIISEVIYEDELNFVLEISILMKL